MKYLTVTYAVPEEDNAQVAVDRIVNNSGSRQSVRNMAWFDMCPSPTEIDENTVLNRHLREYEKEMDMSQYSLTLPQLIDSHRAFRTSRIASREEMLAENQKVYESTIKNARASVLHGEYYSKENLRKMSILELANLLSDQFYD